MSHPEVQRLRESSSSSSTTQIQFQRGHTKLFLSAEAPFLLRSLKDRLLAPHAATLQRWWQGYLQASDSPDARQLARARRRIVSHISAPILLLFRQICYVLFHL